MKQYFRSMLVPLILAGCAPGIEPVHMAQPEGGTTIVIRTSNKLASACMPEKRPIDMLLSTPLAYAGDEDAEPEPTPMSDVAGEEEKPASARPRDACYPGWKQAFYRHGVQRWRCRY